MTKNHWDCTTAELVEAHDLLVSATSDACKIAASCIAAVITMRELRTAMSGCPTAEDGMRIRKALADANRVYGPEKT